MKMHICDRCGKKITRGKLLFGKTEVVILNTTLETHTQKNTYELCCECRKSFKRWIKQKED